MAKYSITSFILLFAVLSPTPNAIASSEQNELNSFIIHTDILTRPPNYSTQSQWYSSIIKSVVTPMTLDDGNPNARIFYTYDTVLHGFAAMLAPEEVERMSQVEGVIGIYNDSVASLHTTRSPDFLGLNLGDDLWTEMNPNIENVIVGLLDTGVWPENPSFSDDGYSPIPPGWQGECVSGDYFNTSSCNKKLIGARFFASGIKARGHSISDQYLSPRDDQGHGTHTSSTAAGSLVPGASLFGFAPGTARGMAPRARLAMYKVCWSYSCANSDIMAAMDAAVRDGVHILSISIGDGIHNYDTDIIAVGAFGAVRNGVFVACSAGNSGPYEGTVVNAAPWITTVGASSIDRKYPSRITLGNGEGYVGVSLFNGVSNISGMIPLVLPSSRGEASKAINGKIVVCRGGSAYDETWIAEMGGAGMVVVNDELHVDGILVSASTLPALQLCYSDGTKLLSYVMSASNPTATLEFNYGSVVGESRAPSMASFSSRGPNVITPEILKPDLIAPGMNILASWPPNLPLTGSPYDKRSSVFNFMSGTSMSCPHVAGIAALVRAAHPDWSPAMVRSAMMTTAFDLDNRYRPIIALGQNHNTSTPLAIGAGHVHPLAAKDPGLVYDAGVQDYINFLCTLNYTESQMSKFFPGPFSCTKLEGGPGDLNYPSFSVVFRGWILVRRYKRTLTKVTDLPESYEARVVEPSGNKVEIVVEPTRLEFGRGNEKLEYVVEFRSLVSNNIHEEQGYVIWENQEHQVKSPVVFMWH